MQAGALLGVMGDTGWNAGDTPNELQRIKITGMETLIVKVTELGNWDFVRLQTDVGITGIGEASHSGASGDKAKALRDIFPLIEGESPFAVEEFRKKFFEKGPHSDGALTTAFCGIEQAMWDICGKALGIPVADMLGGRLHKKLRTYANINRATRGVDRTPEGFARNAMRAIGQGYDAVKAAPFDYMPRPEKGRSLNEWNRLAKDGVECIKAMRDALDSENDLLIDVHSKFDREFGVEMSQRLVEYKLFWYEEPVNPRNAEDLAAINDASPLEVAGGEHVWSSQGFYELFRRDALDIYMPDVKHCGGILELKKIASMADAAGKTCSPHNPSGPVATAASVQVCATLPNFLILEYAWGEVPWSHELVEPAEEFRDGCLHVPERPGLGIEFNEKVLRKHLVRG